MNKEWFFASGLVVCTTMLLIVAILWYNLVIQIMTVLGVISSVVGDTPLTNAPEAMTGMQWLAQVLITLAITAIGIVILWLFHPYGTEAPE